MTIYKWDSCDYKNPVYVLDCLDLFLATLCFLIPFDLLLLATVVSASLQTASHPETFSASIDSSIVKLFFPDWKTGRYMIMKSVPLMTCFQRQTNISSIGLSYQEVQSLKVEILSVCLSPCSSVIASTFPLKALINHSGVLVFGGDS